MNAFSQLLTRRLSTDRFDAQMARWTCGLFSPALLAMVAWVMAKYAGNPGELGLGLGMGLLTSLLTLLGGLLAGCLQERIIARPILHRRRLLEYASYATFPMIFGSGLWYLSTLPLARAGFVIGILLLLSTSLAFISLGILSTLAKVDRI